MCGIVGHFARHGGAMPPDTLFELVQCVSHRGPDDNTYWQDGPYSFGHRRLSIIDLSTGGRQPMASVDGAIVITFNGEIYNYVELRAELTALGQVFRTQSDTEVLINGYRQWGIELLPKLLGMFAFAIADRRKRELLLARDRFGEKPLLYLDDANGTTFASELRPLSRVAREREVDGDALGRYLVLNYVPGEQTLFKGVRRVPPGGWRRYRADGQTERGIYWSPPVNVDSSRSFDEAIDQLEEKLQRAVELTLRSDVPVGIFLSAGIDSSLVARAAVKSGTIARAFSLGFAEQSHSELPGARHTAAKLGLPITEVMLDASALERFTDLVAHADDPLADSSALAVWTLAAETAKHVKVVLAGDGGDELFGGYLTYPATLWHASVTARLPLAVRRAMESAAGALAVGDGKVTTSYKLMRFLRAATLPPGEAHFSWNGTWLPEEAASMASAADLKASARDSLRWMAERHALTGDISLEKLQRADVRDYLANDILVKSDRMSMAHGLEVRAPFLDRDLAEFALRLPARFKAGRRGAGKRILRALARRAYGAEMAGAIKQGFSIPVHEWLRGPARGLIDDLLSPKSIASIGILDGAAIARAVADHQSRRRALGWELWGLMVLAAWHRQQIQRVPASPSVIRPEAVTIPLAS